MDRPDAAPPRRRRVWTPPPSQPDAGALTPSPVAAAGGWRGSTISPALRRLVRALIAWPPLGIAAAALIGEATGCAAFEATCTSLAGLYPWVAQGAIILALLAVPAAARVLAGGTAAVVVLALPVAAVLSAWGASYDRTRGPAALIAVLAVAWAAGIGVTFLRRRSQDARSG